MCCQDITKVIIYSQLKTREEEYDIRIPEVAGFPESLSVSEVFVCVSIAFFFFVRKTKVMFNHYALLLLSIYGVFLCLKLCIKVFSDQYIFCVPRSQT